MKVVVKFQTHVRPQIQTWMRTLGIRADDRRRLGREYLEAMIQHIQRHQGVPPEAIRELGLHPATYRWRFATDYWVRFCVEEEGGAIARLFGRIVKKITILSLETDPPSLMN